MNKRIGLKCICKGKSFKPFKVLEKQNYLNSETQKHHLFSNVILEGKVLNEKTPEKTYRSVFQIVVVYGCFVQITER